MSEANHSLGPTCAYYEDQDLDGAANGSYGPPKLNAQFFYVSSLPIDDPLSPLPPIQTDPKAVLRQPPQPFSARDNAALEEAWDACQKAEEHKKATQNQSKPKALREMFSFPKFRSGLISPGPASPTLGRPDGEYVSSSAHSMDPSRFAALDIGENSGKATQKNAESEPLNPRRKFSPKESSAAESLGDATQVLLSQDSNHIDLSAEPVDIQETNGGMEQPKRRRTFSPFRSRHKNDPSTAGANQASLASAGDGFSELDPTIPTANNSDISGRPFARVPSRRSVPATADGAGESNTAELSPLDDASQPRSHLHNVINPHAKESHKSFVPVGVSRLHLVEMPTLVMKPIYWNPINDQSNVIRATWFYKDSMLPVPAEVANRLEQGFEDMKPYSESYQDELLACIENGASAEMKIVHKLWPGEAKSAALLPALESKQDESGSPETPRLQTPENAAADPRELQNDVDKFFRTYGVIYVDAKNAQILKPSLLPSESRGRRPLNSIRKGRQIGVAVVRGFDRKMWSKLNPDPRMNAKAAHAKVGAYMSQSGDATTRSRRMSCAACESEAKSPKVTDLVLVIHGIGQKLSERVDSFHFTHAINSFRREFNVNLSTEHVKGNLRKDVGGIMVLPVNWRLTVSFEDADSKKKQTSAENHYSLEDITPDTLPMVRSLISDVMLDIPYYLSHHKQKMISAVVKEANRVYRLWCRNNPGFQKDGRVHLIAHSLGSAMVMDILSQQPTHLPQNINLTGANPGDKIFEFDTKNLFCCGSPSGFFLLLNKANLIPRKGRKKPGMEGEDLGRGVAGEPGTYGCLAVDNVYNIWHRNDPIAYQQNACVDKEYAESLAPASIPSVEVGLFTRVTNTFRWSSSSSAAPEGYGTVATAAGAQRPPMQQLPSTVEMSTHNFTRQEIAEKRMYLLNDNGQIDFFLRSGGGPLEIQYLNMLGAHSSYWILQDFVRFLVVEIGREQGRANTLPALRAIKSREYKKSAMV